MTVETGLQQPYPGQQQQGQVIQGQVTQQQPQQGGQVLQGQVLQPYAQYAGTQDNLPATRGDMVELMEGLETGLDDLSIDDIPTPRILINHADGAFYDNQMEVQRQQFIGIILGSVKQRIMWDANLEDDGTDVPKCKSNDGRTGLPNMDPTSDRQYPFDESSFDRNLVPIDPDLNRAVLPCSNCVFTSWSGQGNKTPPRCSEVENLVVMFDAYGTGELQPAFMPMKKSAIKTTRVYLARFKQKGVPAYSEFTHFSLESRMRGKNPYAVPIFQSAGPTNPEYWQDFSKNYKVLREMAHRVRPLEGGADTGVQQQFEEPAQQYSTHQQAAPQNYAPPAPAPSPAPVYQAPLQQQPPVQAVAQSVVSSPPQAPIQAPPVVPVTPVQQPATEAPAPVAPAPPAPPVQYQQPAPPPPPPPPVVVQAPAPPPPAPPAPQPTPVPAPVAPTPAPAPVAQAVPEAPAPAAQQPTAPWQGGTNSDSDVPGEDDGLPF
ncbi:hypothetical protein AB0F25_30670 [Streptomyces wedmorensis]|uniref:hypothetical protein n=1 Tax=Streptomyces wedmorensis TaxID=43759 RepID=UPI00342141AC